MTDSRAAVAPDRLPWLPDEPAPQRSAGAGHQFGWLIAAAILIVALAAYWLGQNNADGSGPASAPVASTVPTTTVPLPRPRLPEPVQPQVEAEPMPEVQPVAAPPSPATRHAPTEPRRERTSNTAAKDAVQAEAASGVETGTATQGDTAPEVQPAPRKTEHPDRPWPVRVTDGASGRLVRVGTFATAPQAKKGWWAIVRNNPSLKRLPALVVPAPSLRDGRTYYRLQMGTTSQAHSEVLCQRMRAIGQSCVVIEVYNRGQGSS